MSTLLGDGQGASPRYEVLTEGIKKDYAASTARGVVVLPLLRGDNSIAASPGAAMDMVDNFRTHFWTLYWLLRISA